MILSKNVLLALTNKPELIDTYISLYNESENINNKITDVYLDHFCTCPPEDFELHEKVQKLKEKVIELYANIMILLLNCSMAK